MKTLVVLVILCISATAVFALPLSSIISNFNGTSVPDTRFIWFNSHLTSVATTGTITQPLIIYFRNQTVTIKDGATTLYTLAIPDGEVRIDSSTGTATTTFTGGDWITKVSSSSGNPFLAGLAFDVPTGGADVKGANPVTWSGEFFANQAGVTKIQWQWSAAVYNSFTTDNSLVLPTPIDGAGGFSQSGTPSAFAYSGNCVGGARGGGASNYTGSNSGTGDALNLSVLPEPATIALLGLGASMLFLKRRS